ncbi:MAG: serine protease [Actinomycetota bacterium]
MTARDTAAVRLTRRRVMLVGTLAFTVMGFLFIGPSASAPTVARALGEAPTTSTVESPDVDTMTPPAKDGWDKLSAVSGLVTGGLVAAIGIAATVLYNRRQLAVQAATDRRSQDVRTVDVASGLVPYLASEDPRQVETALVLLDTLGNQTLARDLSVLYPSEGGFAALDRLSRGPSGDAVSVAALNDLIDRLAGGIPSVVGDRSLGLGVAVAPDLVATAHWIVTESSGPLSLSIGGRSLPAQVAHSTQSLVLLRTESSEHLHVLQLRPSAGLPVGTEVRALVPGDFGTVLESGRLLGVADVHFGEEPASSQRVLVADLVVRQGTGGTPVLDRDGAVIGIVTAMDPDLRRAFIVPSEEVVALMDGTD